MSFTPNKTHLASISKYQRKAKIYDTTIDGTNSIRSQTIALLQLQAGASVLDVGCGSAVSIPALREGVGNSGCVYGFDQSPEMLAIASRKATQMQWTNVSLQHGFAEAVRFERPLDAILFHYTHDILQSQAAIDNILSQAKPGARVAIAGMKNFPWWTGPLMILSFCKNFAWNGNPSGLTKPWRLIRPQLDDFQIRSTQWGMGYIASGTIKRSVRNA